MRADAIMDPFAVVAVVAEYLKTFGEVMTNEPGEECVPDRATDGPAMFGTIVVDVVDAQKVQPLFTAAGATQGAVGVMGQTGQSLVTAERLLPFVGACAALPEVDTVTVREVRRQRLALLAPRTDALLGLGHGGRWVQPVTFPPIAHMATTALRTLTASVAFLRTARLARQDGGFRPFAFLIGTLTSDVARATVAVLVAVGAAARWAGSGTLFLHHGSSSCGATLPAVTTSAGAFVYPDIR